MENQQQAGYPSLTKSYKGMFPFKIATTSFIYPDHYVPNVRMLGAFVDEIELLIFESTATKSLLSKTVIDDLSHLSREFNLTYNIHLPTDVSISDPSAARQQQAVETLIQVIEQVIPLQPVSYTLHIPFHDDHYGNGNVREWQDCVRRNLGKILTAGVPGNMFAIETLDYPFENIEKIINALDLSICADIGHLILSGYDIKTFMAKYSGRTSIIHLHGVENNHDHVSIDHLPQDTLKSILSILSRFTATVSLEVFSFHELKTSLKLLEQSWENMTGENRPAGGTPPIKAVVDR